MNIGRAPAVAPRRKVVAKRRKASSPDPACPETASEVAHLKAAVASMGLRLSKSVHQIGMLEGRKIYSSLAASKADRME